MMTQTVNKPSDAAGIILSLEFTISGPSLYFTNEETCHPERFAQDHISSVADLIFPRKPQTYLPSYMPF